MSKDSSEKIVRELRDWIASEPAGAQLPSTRALVERFRASPLTVQRALTTLAARGLIETQPGVGTFIRRQHTAPPADYSWQSSVLGAAPLSLREPASALRDAPADAIALHSGYPDPTLLPTTAVRTALTRAARSAAALSAAPTAGRAELRSWFATQLGAWTRPGISAPTASDVVIVPGSQAALSSIFRTLAGPKALIIAESPTYWGAIAAATQAGVRIVPISSGPTGPDPEALGRTLRDTGARMLYLQPTFANPTGAIWDNDRADAVIALARKHEAFIVEDDWARDFAIDRERAPLAAADTEGRVVYLRSLTKSLSPAIRVGAVIARGPVRRRILADVSATSLYVSEILQDAALDVVQSTVWKTHLRRLPTLLAQRRDTLIEALHAELPEAHVESVPHGGLNLWLRLPENWDIRALTMTCQARGVYLAAGHDWFPAEPSGNYLRLSFAGLADTGGDLCDGLRTVRKTGYQLFC